MALVLNSNKPVASSTALNYLDLLSADQLKQNYVDRVSKDGGVIVDDNYLTAVCSFLATNKLAGKVHTIASASLGVKYNSSTKAVYKLYNLVSDFDLVPEEYKIVNNKVTIQELSAPILYVEKTSSNRAYCYYNLSGSENALFGAGRALVQKNQYASINKCLSVSTVAELPYPSAFVQMPQAFSVFSFANNDDSKNRALIADVSNKSDGITNTALLYAYTTAQDVNPSSGSLIISAQQTGNRSLFVKKDAVLHYYCSQDESEKLATSMKQSATSDTYTNVLTQNNTALTKVLKEQRQFSLNASFYSDGGALSYTNWRIYDVFVMRDLNNFNQSKLVRDFIESQLKAFYGARS
ncbi:hypothetical protein [Acinetobacter bereziniae]|uniref:hypothetical protein n=1 Tax=Acinetobacter bereziniae TaxID=106648 RepID=UPI0030189604